MSTKTDDLTNSTVHPRAGTTVHDVVRQLQEHPGDWVEYSRHQTRGAARQRVHSLRSGATFRKLPVEWATRRDVPGDIHAQVRIYVRWRPGAPVNLPGTDTPPEGL